MEVGELEPGAVGELGGTWLRELEPDRTWVRELEGAPVGEKVERRGGLGGNFGARLGIEPFDLVHTSITRTYPSVCV